MHSGSLRKIVLLLAAALACVFLGIIALVVVIPAAAVLLVASGFRRAISGLRQLLRSPRGDRAPARPAG